MPESPDTHGSAGKPAPLSTRTAQRRAEQRGRAREGRPVLVSQATVLTRPPASAPATCSAVHTSFLLACQHDHHARNRVHRPVPRLDPGHRLAVRESRCLRGQSIRSSFPGFSGIAAHALGAHVGQRQVSASVPRPGSAARPPLRNSRRLGTQSTRCGYPDVSGNVGQTRGAQRSQPEASAPRSGPALRRPLRDSRRLGTQSTRCGYPDVSGTAGQTQGTQGGQRPVCTSVPRPGSAPRPPLRCSRRLDNERPGGGAPA